MMGIIPQFMGDKQHIQSFICNLLATSTQADLSDRPAIGLLLLTGNFTVCVFAGPSAHGKTYVSRLFATLLPSTNFLLVDCTNADHAADILGSGARFRGSDTQPILADFLLRNSGRRSVVVLDEFEKVGRSYGEAADAFLKIFEEGKHSAT